MAAAEAAQERAREAARANIGKLIPGQGIYLGTWQPKDKDGKSLGRIFNVYAAPQDLTDASGKQVIFKYDHAIKRVAALKNWHGHDGTNYETDKDLHRALKTGSYKGGWIIPPRELLNGLDAHGNKTQGDNLLALKDHGALKGTFITKAAPGYTYPEYYWSSTESHNNPSTLHTTDFSTGRHSQHYKDVLHLSCRPVRLVPA